MSHLFDSYIYLNREIKIISINIINNKWPNNIKEENSSITLLQKFQSYNKVDKIVQLNLINCCRCFIFLLQKLWLAGISKAAFRLSLKILVKSLLLVILLRVAFQWYLALKELLNHLKISLIFWSAKIP